MSRKAPEHRMTLHFRTVQLGSPRQRSEGLRIGAVRFLPRGVAKVNYARLDYFDVWLPSLAPSRELLKALRAGKLSPAEFFRRYRSEMSKTEPRQVIELLANLAARTPISVGCYCSDESQCHRKILGELIRQAAGR